MTSPIKTLDTKQDNDESQTTENTFDEQNLPDETAIDEMKFRELWDA